MFAFPTTILTFASHENAKRFQLYWISVALLSVPALMAGSYGIVAAVGAIAITAVIPGIYSSIVAAVVMLAAAFGAFGTFRYQLSPDASINIYKVLPPLVWLATLKSVDEFRLNKWTFILPALAASVVLAGFFAGVIKGIDVKTPQLVLLFVLSTFATVWSEEVFFRELIQKRFLGRLPMVWRVLAVAVIFTVLHFAFKPVLFVWVFIAGVIYAFAYEKTGLRGAVISHVTLNLVHYSLFNYSLF